MTDDGIFENDFPPVTPGVKVLIQLKSGRYYQVDTEGNRTSEDKFLPCPVTEMIVKDHDECYPDNWAEYYESPGDAMHGQTICRECIDSWAMDWYIVLAE